MAETRRSGAPSRADSRITKRREMSELNLRFKELEQIGVDGIMVSNWGTWWRARPPICRFFTEIFFEYY